MKKLLFLIACFAIGITHAQNQAIDTTRYDYIGQRIDSTIYMGNSTYLNTLFDKEYLIQKVTKQSDDKFVKEFNEGFTRGLNESFNLGDRIVQDVGDYGSYDFVKSRVNSKGEHHLLFRLYSEEGLNYHDYQLQKVDGEIKIVDVYIFTTGEYLSKTFSDLYNATLSQKPNILDKFLKKTLLDDLVKINTIKAYIGKGNYQEAFKLYKSISSEGKKQKSIKLIGVILSSNVSEEAYGKLIKEYEALFPNDPSLYLVSIDGYILSERYNRALKQIKLLDRAVGGDSFLNYLRTNIYYADNNMEKALETIETFMKDFPGFFDGYDVALTLYIESGKSKKAVDILNIMVDDFYSDKDELKKVIIENFPSFSKKAEFIEWSK